MIGKIFIIAILYIIIIGLYTGMYFFFKNEFSLTIIDFNNTPTNVPITIIDCALFSCSIFSANGYASSDLSYIKPKSKIAKMIVASEQIISLFAIVFGIGFIVGNCNKKLKIDNETLTKYSHMKKIISQDSNALNNKVSNVINSESSVSNIDSTNISNNDQFNQSFKIIPVN